MCGSLVIDIELLKLFVAFYKEKWDLSECKVTGDFKNLKKILPENNYRTFLDNRHLIDLVVLEDGIIFKPEEIGIKNKIMTEISNTKKMERIIKVVKENCLDEFIEQLLLGITLYSAIEICSEPKKNKLEYFEEDSIYHENNLQSKISARMSRMNDSFHVILEKKFNIGDNKYLKPDIVIEYEKTELYIELKLGKDKCIIKKFYEDIKKIQKNYSLAIALCYDPKQHIKKDNNIKFSNEKIDEFINKNYNESLNTNIYFVMERKIEKFFNLKKNTSSQRVEVNKEKQTTNLAFAIYNKTIQNRRI